MRMNFAFTYIGPALHSGLLESVGAKVCESCVDSRGFTHVFISTQKQKRATTIESGIKSWNNEQPTDATKIRFHPFPGESNVVIFTKTPGHTAADHFIMKTIKEARQKSTAGEESTYRFWSASDSFATHAQPTKRRSVNKELEIDMHDAFGAKRTAREPAGLGGPAVDVIAPEASAMSFASLPADYSTQSDDDEGEQQAEQQDEQDEQGEQAVLGELPEARILGYEVVDPNSPEIIRAKDEVIKAKDLALSKAEETIRAKNLALTKANETIRAKDQLIKAKDLAYKQMEAAKNEAIIRMNFHVDNAVKSVESKDRILAGIAALVATS
jgi:hypothetical protein